MSREEAEQYGSLPAVVNASNGDAMNRFGRLTIGTASVAALLLLAGGTEAAERKFHATLSGSFVTTAIDTDGTGSKAVLTILNGSSSLGQIAAQGVGEWKNVALETCPLGSIEAQIVTAKGVLQAPDGDTVFTEFTSGTSCSVPATGATTYTTEGSFIGGTGRFLGATGALQATGTVQTLVSDPSNNEFGAVTTEVAGTLTTPAP